MARVAINGMGRIGRALFKNLVDTPGLDIVAVNDIAPLDNTAYLLKYDSVYGRYEKPVSTENGTLVADGERYQYVSEKNPGGLPWDELNIDVVFECTGLFTTMDKLRPHIEAGARHVILSAPAKDEEVEMVVHGVNKPGNNQVISCASCTTNCISPVAEVMDRHFGVAKATMTTIHAYTSSQNIVDGPHKKWRRGRAGAINFVPTSTGAAIATTKAIPKLEGKFDGVAVRGPIPVGSIADVVFHVKESTSVEEANGAFEEEAGTDRYADVLAVAEDPIVSSDIIKDPHASVLDPSMTQVVGGDLVKIMSWYDNEWGYVNQMIRESRRILNTEQEPAEA
ncbi:MAG TPA: type I glyceraldehyde-3-phosphate dehydrogenase [bacterium]|nr:type I glyceraldehyde-3-phosphate dehydrogenase [bacterium]